MYNKVLSSKSTVDCVSCENNIRFIADTGASDHFTSEMLDFVTFAKMDGQVKTADEESTLEILGYGTVFIQHTIIKNGTECTVTTKLLLYIMPLAWLTDY